MSEKLPFTKAEIPSDQNNKAEVLKNIGLVVTPLILSTLAGCNHPSDNPEYRQPGSIPIPQEQPEK